MAKQDEFAMRRLLMQKQMADALSKGAYIQPGEPPAKAWQPVIQQLGGLIQGKRLTGEEQESRKRYQDKLASALSPVEEPAETLPDGVLGPTRPGTSRPKYREEVAQELLKNPDTAEMGLKLYLQKFSQHSQPNGPYAVQETEWYLKQPKETQIVHDRLKRAQQTLNLGGQQVVLDPRGGVRESYAVTPKPEQMPGFKAAQTTATETAKLGVDKQAALPKLRLSVQNVSQRANRVSDAVDKALMKVDYLTAGAIGSVGQKIPGTTARDLKAQIDTIKANVGFDELNAMRQSSPTGGALGQVSERELGYLQSVLANLEQSQSPEQLKENLQAVKQEVNSTWNRVRQAFEQDYGPGSWDAQMKGTNQPNKPTASEKTITVDW